jgi:molecular chaperone DnaK
MAIIGIDLGTTNSAVAVMKNGKPAILENKSGFRTTPSIVVMDVNGTISVGEHAKDSLISAPDRTVLEVKRLMGTDQMVKVGDTEYRPEEVSAMILKELKAAAEEKLGTAVTEAVITVPAYFTDGQRKATQRAGELAGLKVERILNEPTAAAISYGLENMGKDAKVLVYDLGGGTFDVSVVELFEGILEVKASAGNNHLGGMDFDDAILNWVVDKVKEIHKFDLLSEGTAQELAVRKNRLKLEAEKIKKALSGSPSAQFNLPFLAMVNGAPLSIDLEITRAQFEKLIKDLAVSTLDEVDKALKDANISASDIDEVLLVGGSTRIPYIQELVAKKFGKEPRKDINPDEAVALGAAVQAGIKTGEIDSRDGLMVTDVCPYTLGVSISREVGDQLVSGYFDRLIERNMTIPITKSNVYYTIYDNQEFVTIKVYQGEDTYAQNNIYLGEISLPDIPKGPAGQEVKITFQYNINGILTVEAELVSTGRRVSTVIKGKGVMSEQEMAAAKQKMDKTFEQSELFQSVKAVVNRAEKVLDDLSDADRMKVEQMMEKLKQAIVRQDQAQVAKYEEELTDLLIEVV